MPDPQQAPIVGQPDRFATSQAELEKIVQGLIDSGKSEAEINHRIDKFDDDHDTMVAQTLHELRGVIKGAPTGAVMALKGVLWDLPATVLSGAVDRWHGEPPKDVIAAMDTVTALKSLPAQFLDATHEERGQMIGEVLGGFKAMQIAPGAPRPIARGVGTAVEQTAHTFGAPFRIGAAYKLMSGNPIGAAMIGAPKMVEASSVSQRSCTRRRIRGI